MKNLIILISIFSFTNSFSQGIQISFTPDTLTLSPGQSQQLAVNITPSGGFNQQIFLYQSCTFNCTGLSLSFTSNPVIFPYTLTATLTVGGNAAFGSHDFLIIGDNGPVSDSTVIHLEVSPYNCVFTPLTTTFNRLTQILATPNGVWAGGQQLGNYSSSGNLNILSGTPFPGDCTGLTEDSQHNLWISTVHGIAKFDGTYWSVFNNTNTNFTTQWFSSIAVDSSDNVWATAITYPNQNGDGLYKYDGSSWIKYDSLNNSLPSNTVAHITFDRNGLLWAYFWSYTLHSYKIYNYDGITWTPISWPDSCMPIYAPTQISFDSQNNAWFGTGDDAPENAIPQNGLIKYDGASAEIWTDSVIRPFNHFKYDTGCNLILSDSSSQIPSAGIHNVFVDHSDRVWAATVEEDEGKGVVLVDGTNFTIFNQANSLLGQNSVYGFSESNDTIYLLSDFYFMGGMARLSAYTCGAIISSVSNEKTDDIKLFPNPSSGEFKIDFPENLSQPARLRIFDLAGKIVFETVLKNSGSVIQLNISDGFYPYVIENDKQRYAGKLVINKY